MRVHEGVVASVCNASPSCPYTAQLTLTLAVSLARDVRYANIEGGQVMEEMSQLANGIATTKLEQDEMEGVDEDEWGDDDEDDD